MAEEVKQVYGGTVERLARATAELTLDQEAVEEEKRAEQQQEEETVAPPSPPPRTVPTPSEPGSSGRKKNLTKAEREALGKKPTPEDSMIYKADLKTAQTELAQVNE